MSDFIEKIADQINLSWAWEKVKNESTNAEIWVDEISLSAFEIDLENNLSKIASEFKEGNYKLTPMKPLPFPKQPDCKGNKRLRQVFEISIRDQVAWTAIVNIIGPLIDFQMPTWSYGNRLYRAIWVDEDGQGKKKRKIGSYRHASGKIYLPFRQGWPIFRRHIYLTTRAMTRSTQSENEENEINEMDERDLEELELQKTLRNEYQCPFINADYWTQRVNNQIDTKLFWCSLDLQKFYPTLKLNAVLENILELLPSDWVSDASEVINSMMEFKIDTDGWETEDLNKIDIKKNQVSFNNIPTGLYVAGFLANVGLLKIDLQIEKVIAVKNVAHFRYVDDHIIIAYNFEDIKNWISDYERLLNNSNTGAKINLDKVEPKELGKFLMSKKSSISPRHSKKIENKAYKSCLLDKQFPSPLMTKTMAMVSGIANVDFNLLESNELSALTQQLEHLLLVDIPEEEIPEKTRLSFSAIRLTRIAECRLANPEAQTTILDQINIINNLAIPLDSNSPSKHQYDAEIKLLHTQLKKEKAKVKKEINRLFQLLLKVIKDRPDRVRLWARAIIMCRITGVKGLSQLLNYIRDEEIPPLSKEYLYATLFSLLSSQCMIAANILVENSSAHWQKEASISFLKDVQNTIIDKPSFTDRHSFIKTRWDQFCFGVYCTKLILKSCSETLSFTFSPNKKFKHSGLNCLRPSLTNNDPVDWAWWAARKTLKRMSPRADNFIAEIGYQIITSKKVSQFWRFFPFEISDKILSIILTDSNPDKNNDGWLLDVIRGKIDKGDFNISLNGYKQVKKIVGIYSHIEDGYISLYDWCSFIRTIPNESQSDPRNSEWTALEIVKQISWIISKPREFKDYLKSLNSINVRPSIHPCNFMIPRTWMEVDKLNWVKWSDLTRNGDKIKYSLNQNIIRDERFNPIQNNNPLSTSINPSRGLGLILYGLLKKSFDFPTLWNGPGHAQVLNLLPKLLLSEMSISSWTLGVLWGCLQPRSTENIYFNINPNLKISIDDDTINDPLSLIQARDVYTALRKCQITLEKYQLSTLNFNSRQLTPISILQLTKPNWDLDFKKVVE